MSTTTKLRMIAISGVAIILALFTVQGTLAVWNQTAAAKAQVVTGADFSLAVKQSGATAQRLSVSGQMVTVPGIDGLLPGATRTISLTLTNTSDAGSGAFRVRVSPGTPKVAGPLAAHLTADIQRVQGTDCTAPGDPSALELGQGQSGTLCLTASLAANAPATLGGTSASLVVDLNAMQLP